MKIVRFLGRRSAGPNDSLATPPIAGVWYVGTRPSNFSESTPLFTELTFDRPFAERHGRNCGEACDGDCWAEFFAATWNVGHEKQPMFAVRDPSPEPTPDAADAPSPSTKKAANAAKAS